MLGMDINFLTSIVDCCRNFWLHWGRGTSGRHCKNYFYHLPGTLYRFIGDTFNSIEMKRYFTIRSSRQ